MHVTLVSTHKPKPVKKYVSQTRQDLIRFSKFDLKPIIYIGEIQTCSRPAY
jgi:hypothetical protein